MNICSVLRYVGPVVGASMIYFFWPTAYDIAYRPFVMLLPIIGGIIVPMCLKSCRNSKNC